MKKEKIRVLIIEDNENDLALLLRELNKGKYEIEYELTEDAVGLESALKKKWSIIISDYSLPNFNGFEALKMCNAKGLVTPFIMVSGTIGEDIAVEMMKAGAKDYIMKKSLKRLLPAVEREIEEAKIRIRNRLIAKEKDIISEINKDILNTDSLDELLKIIYTNIKKVVYADNCFIALYNSEKEEISFPFYVDEIDPPPSPRKKGNGFTEYIMDTGKPLLLEPDTINKMAESKNIMITGSIPESWLGIPLLSHSKPIGVLVVTSYDKEIKYSEKEKIFLSGIANQIALAIERKQTEESLRESEYRFKILAEAAPVGIFRTDENGITNYVNPKWCEIAKMNSNDAMGNGWYNSVHPEDKESLSISWRNAILSKSDSISEYRFVRSDGSIAWVIGWATPQIDENEKVIGYIGTMTDITERKLAEEALFESEERYRVFINSTNDMAFLKDSQFRYMLINRTNAEFFGKDEIEIIGKSDLDLMPKRAAYRCLESDNMALSSDSVVVNEEYIGEKIYESRKFKVHLSNGMFGIGGYIRDITEKKLAEKALRKSEEKYRTIFENVQDVFYQIDLDGIIIEISPSVEKYIGYKREEIIGKSADLFYASKKEREYFINTILERKEIADYEIIFKSKSGKFINTSVNAHIYYDSNGKSLGIEGSLRDVSERKKSEEALKESEERYRILIETMHDGVIQVDNEDKIQFVNNCMCEMLGYTYNELIGKVSIDTIVFEEDKEIVMEKNRLRLEGISDIYEIRGVKKSGDIIWLSISGAPIGNKNGKVIGSVGFLSDITERKHAEEEIIKISQAIKQSPVVIIMTDVKGIIEYVNPKFTEVTGYNPEEVIGKKPNILKSGDMSSNGYKLIWDTIISGKDWVGEFHNKKKNGELYWENASISPVKNSNGKITHFLAIKEDITEKKQKEIELINAKEKAEESERLKSSFLANMSHELRTPMVGILGFAELMKDLAESSELKDFADNIIKSGKRLMETLNLILDISRIEADRMEIKLSEINIVHLTSEVYKNYIKEAEKKNIKIIFKSSEDVIMAKVDERMLWESVNNLINNALKYTKRGGVTIEILKKIVNKDNKVLIKITDTGIGIPKESINTIFEEFRQVSEGYSRGFEGTGLGLTVTKNFIEKIGGTISVESDLGVGSVFTIELPVLESCNIISTVEDKKEIVKKEKSVIGKKDIHILCVDDDSFTREYLGYILKDIYNVAFADNGIAAIELSKSQKFSLILMDINLGKGMNGLEATKKIRKLPGYADIPVIVITAFAMKGDREEFLDSGMSEYISKPFKSAELLKIIEKVLC
jgi:PAS domain S-box-containing protein